MSLANNRFGGRIEDRVRSSTWRHVLIVFLVMRVVLCLWMWGVRQIFDQTISPHPVLRPYLGVALETNPWLEPWQRWDTLHYQAIAERGYQAFEGSLFTPPLFPLLIRLLDDLTGWGTLLCGIIISNLAFLVALKVLFELVEMETGSRKLAGRTLICLASFPTAFFFLAGYTESLFLLAAVLCIYYARRGYWLFAGGWAAVAALTRLTGVLLIIPLAYAAWQETRTNLHWRPWVGTVVAALGALLFPLYIWLALDLLPWEPWLAQTSRFQGGLAFPGYSLLVASRSILSGQARLADWFDIGFLLLFLATLPAMYRQLPRIHAVYQGSFLLLYLARVSHIQPLLANSRYVLALYPAFIIFAIWGSNPWVQRLYLYTSWLGLLLLSGQYAIWGWVG